MWLHVQVVRLPIVSPSENQIISKVFIISMESRDPLEGAFVLRLLPGGAASSPNALFSKVSAPACQKCYIFPMDFNDSHLGFSKSYWRPHFSYGFDMTSSCRKCCGLPKLTKFQRIQFYHIFSTFFNDFMLAQFSMAFAK